MITPTVGRIVWFYPHGSDLHASPLAAIVTAVWTPTRVNLCVLSQEGVPYPTPPNQVLFVQDGGQRPESGRAFCTWPNREESPNVAALAVADVDVASAEINFSTLAFGDRIRIITDLLRGIDATLLDDIYAAWKVVLAATETKAKIEAALSLARLLADATTQTDIDDRFVDAAAKIVQGPLLELVAAIIDRWRAQQAGSVAHAASFEALTAEEEAAFEAAGVDPVTVLMILNFLWDLWQSRK